MKWMLRCLALVLCAVCLGIPVLAAEVDSGSVYCFGSQDFGEEGLRGICLTSLPEQGTGTVQLGERLLRPGDVLTASQAAQMTFAPADTRVDRVAEVGYIPIYDGNMEAQTTMKLTIRGKEDQAPIAEDSAFETYKNLEVTNRLKVREPEQQTMTFELVRPPRRGTVTLGEDGSFTYTPKKNKVGVDSFTFVAKDSTGQSSREATVTVTILKPMDGAQYADTAGKDCCFTAEWMKNTGIFTGERLGEKSCFGPEKTVTQGEFLTMLVKTLDIPVEEELNCAGYEDAPSWLKPYLAAAVRSGLMEYLPTFHSEEIMELNDAQRVINGLLHQEDEAVFALEDRTLTRADAASLLYSLSQKSKPCD